MAAAQEEVGQPEDVQPEPDAEAEDVQPEADTEAEDVQPEPDMEAEDVQPEPDMEAEEPPAASEPAPATAEPAGEAAPGKDVEEILVTGSRIKRTGLVTPTPTTVLDADLILQSGDVNLAEMLNELPAVARGYASQNTTYGFGRAGLNQVDLRNLGVHRTLVLVDGRRAVGTPDDYNFIAFDFGTLSPLLIDRVEVITGGASAVYGADAVSGVINIITKKDFEGAAFDFQFGTASGDANRYRISAIAGTNFDAERGNVTVNFNFSDNQGVMRTDRDYQTRGLQYIANPDNTGPDDGIPNQIARDGLRYLYYGMPSGTFWLPVDSNLQRSATEWNRVTFDSKGKLRLFKLGPGGIINNSRTDGGEGGLPGNFSQMTVPLRRFNVFGRGYYEIFGNTKALLQGTVSRTLAIDRIDPGFLYEGDNNSMSIDNPYVTDELRKILLGDPNDPSDDITQVSVGRQNREYGHRVAELQRDFISLGAGLQGFLPNGWDWEAVYQTGGTMSRNTKYNDQRDARFARAQDAVIDPATGQIVCRDQSDGCAPINVLGPEGTISPEALDYVLTKQHLTMTMSRQHLFSAFLRGDAVQLPAGSLAFAAGIEYREEGIDFRPSYVYENGLGFYASQFSPVEAEFNVKEAFVEVNVPVVEDAFLLHQANLEAAARIASYNLAGENFSWKVGGDWAPTRDLRFRVVFARSARAPSLGELFNPGDRGAMGLNDPCDALYIEEGSEFRKKNCQALGIPENFESRGRNLTTLVFTTGNEGLEVEKANTLTLGAVLTPRWVPDLAITVDYWDILLKEGINQFGAQTILNNCVDLGTIDNPFCGLITRGTDYNIDEILDTYLNVARYAARGLDFEANYRLGLPSAIGSGSLRFRVIGSYLMRLNFAAAPGTADEEGNLVDKDAGEYGNPRWRGFLNTTYYNGPFSFNIHLRYVGSQENNVQRDNEELWDPPETPSIWYSDVQARYSFGQVPLATTLEIYAGVNNVFNREPPDHPWAYLGRESLYDVLGRFYYMGISSTF